MPRPWPLLRGWECALTEATVPDTETQVARRHLIDICSQLRRSGAFIIATDTLMAWLVARNGREWLWPALAWWVIAVALPMYRRRMALKYQALEGPAVHRALQRMVHLSGAVGIVRALIIVLAFATGHEETQVLTTLIVFGLAAGATATSGGSHRSMAYWGIPVFAALAGCWIWRGVWIDWLMAGLMLLMLGVLVGYVKALGTQQRELIETADALRVEHDRVESVNRSISLLVDQLRDERDRAAAASESKTRFLASASHDLRQPLYALGLHSTTLEDLAQELKHPQLLRVSNGIQRSVEQSRQLLNSLLDISKLEARAVEVHWLDFELQSYLEAVLPQYEALAREKGLDFAWPSKTAPSPWVRSDPALLERVLGNLLHNAVKFTDRGTVGVRVREDATEVVLEVFDTGPGIAAAERERVFEEFYQIDNPSRDRTRGLGLGLSIVRLLAPLLEARVELRDEPNGGCCFSIVMQSGKASMQLRFGQSAARSACHRWQRSAGCW